MSKKMTPRQEKATLLLTLCSYYDKDMSELGAKMYVDLLEPYPVEKVAEAMNLAVRHERFFPVFAVLRDYMEPTAGSQISDKAEQQCEIAKQGVMYYTNPKFDDPVTEYIMRHEMPIGSWKNRNENEFHQYFAVMFLKTYKRIAGNPHEMKQIEERKEVRSAKIIPLADILHRKLVAGGDENED